MDYNFKFESLIHKNNIDLHHPWFFENVSAKNLLQRLWKNVLPGGGRILILSDKRGDYENFRIHIPKDIKYASYIYDNDTFLALDKCIEDIKEIEKDKVFLISYNDHIRFSVELEKNGIEVFDLYDYFIENGLELSHDFYKVADGTYFDEKGKASADTFYECNYGMLFYDKRKYYLAKSETMQQYYLEKVIFDCFFMKDFVNGEAFIQKYTEQFPESAVQYQDFLTEIKALLQEIRQTIEKQDKKDIILYWIDALSYGEDREMPYLYTLDKECMVYRNMFTTVDTTGGVISSFFGHEMPLESRKFKYKELMNHCYLIDCLKQEGWKFKYYGLEGIFDDEYVRNIARDRHISIVSSENYWQMLCEMAEDTEPAFRIVHLMGCHTPFLSGDIDGEEYLPLHGLFCKQDADMERRVFSQRISAMGYEDRQMAFYDQMIVTAGKIYFSDHGCHARSGTNFAELYHTILKVKSDKLGVGENRQVFSVIDLGKLVQYLVLDDKKYYDSIVFGHAIICGPPYYSEAYVNEVYQPVRFNEMIHLGYWGIVQEGTAFFLCNCGVELCYEIRENRAFLMGYHRSKELRETLRRKLEPHMQTIEMSHKFKFTKVLSDLYGRLKEKDDMEETRQKGIQFCRELIGSISSDERIVIRSGGEDTVMFLDCLTPEQRRRIACIVDNNKQCAANNWDIPVLSVDDIRQLGKVTAIIASSNYRLVMAEELKKNGNVTAIDMYERLYKCGFPKERFLSDILYGKRLLHKKEDFIPIDWEKIEEQDE